MNESHICSRGTHISEIFLATNSVGNKITDFLCLAFPAFQDVAFSDPTQDLALGQLVVLLQYNWPREEERFASIITAIQKRKKFSIADYLPYIIGILMTHVYYMLPWFGHIHLWK